MMKRSLFTIFFLFISIASFGEEIPFTILTTSDLHSRFEPNVDPFHLGGVARLKSAMDQIERESEKRGSAVIRLDAGDCTEGSIFFNSGAGSASYKIMNLLGYDAITVGNHDWYVGLNTLDDVLTQVNPEFSFISANFNWKNVSDHPLQNKIKRYEVFYLVNGKLVRKGDNGFEPEQGKEYFKIGVFGLSTNEAAFSFFFNPVEIGNPLAQARREVRNLRVTEKVDVVILLSHLIDEDDIRIAENLSSVDLVIGGHSHHKVIPRDGKPIVIQRKDESAEYNTTWLVKTGEYGQFLGQVDLVYDTTQKKMVWKQSRYRLNQVDLRFKEDERVKFQVDAYKTELSEKYKKRFKTDIFSDHIADSEINLFKSDVTESFLGNIVVNAILEKAKPFGAQFAVNNSGFLSSHLYRGPIHSAMLYDLLPHIYKPSTDKSWTIWTFEIDGASLKRVIDLVFSMGLFFDVSGIEIIYDLDHFPERVMGIHYRGEEVANEKRYKVAASEGIIEALKQIKDREFPGLVMEDTGIEIWDALREYVRSHSPLRANDVDIRVSGRIRMVQPDLSVLSEDIVVTPLSEEQQTKLNVRVVVQNLGYGGLLEDELAKAATDSTEIKFYYDQTSEDAVDDISIFKPLKLLFNKEYRLWSPTLIDFDREVPGNLEEIDKAVIPSLKKDEKAIVSVKWDTSKLKKHHYPYTLYVLLNRASGTGFVTRPSDDGREGKEIRKFIKVEENNVDNNVAQTFVYLAP